MIEHTGFVGFNDMTFLQEVFGRPSQKNWIFPSCLVLAADFQGTFLRSLRETLPGKTSDQIRRHASNAGIRLHNISVRVQILAMTWPGDTLDYALGCECAALCNSKRYNSSLCHVYREVVCVAVVRLGEESQKDKNNLGQCESLMLLFLNHLLLWHKKKKNIIQVDIVWSDLGVRAKK